MPIKEAKNKIYRNDEQLNDEQLNAKQPNPDIQNICEILQQIC